MFSPAEVAFAMLPARLPSRRRASDGRILLLQREPIIDRLSDHLMSADRPNQSCCCRTRDLCRDSTSKASNSLESGGTDGSFQRPEERLAPLIAPLSHPRPLSCKPLPNSEFGLMKCIGMLSSGDNWLMLRYDHGIPMRRPPLIPMDCWWPPAKL